MEVRKGWVKFLAWIFCICAVALIGFSIFTDFSLFGTSDLNMPIIIIILVMVFVWLISRGAILKSTGRFGVLGAISSILMTVVFVLLILMMLDIISIDDFNVLRYGSIFVIATFGLAWVCHVYKLFPKNTVIAVVQHITVLMITCVTVFLSIIAFKSMGMALFDLSLLSDVDTLGNLLRIFFVVAGLGTIVIPILDDASCVQIGGIGEEMPIRYERQIAVNSPEMLNGVKQAVVSQNATVNQPVSEVPDVPKSNVPTPPQEVRSSVQITNASINKDTKPEEVQPKAPDPYNW